MSLIIEVPPDLERRIREEAAKQGQAVSDYLRPVLEALVAPREAPDSGGGAPSLVELFEGVWSRTPEEDRRKLPADLAEQHDHYAYGTPRRHCR